MGDYIVRATAANHQIRAFAATTRDLVEHARAAHNTSPVATAALGRLLTAGSMMGVMMKGDKDLLTLQIKAGGPLEGITVTADSKGNVKGYVGNPNVVLHANAQGKLDVAGAVGVGFMNVIKDMGILALIMRSRPSSRPPIRGARIRYASTITTFTAMSHLLLPDRIRLQALPLPQ